MQIQLEKLRFHAHHGVMPQERVTGQDYELDLTLSLRDSVAIQALTADRLESTVNYADVYDVVAHEMHQPSSLLEYVAERIVEALLRQFPQVMAVEVRLTKLAPPSSDLTDEEPLLCFVGVVCSLCWTSTAPWPIPQKVS